MSETVAIIGASEKPDRYAYRAMLSLREHGHEVRLVNPYRETIEGSKCYSSVADINEKIDTVTLYVNPERFRDHVADVIRARPQRVIMNPGTEDALMQKMLRDAGIEVLRACTLVMLSTGSF